MTISFQSVIDFFVSLFNKYFTDLTLKFAAYKVLLYSFLTVAFPAVVKNLLAWLFGVLTSQVDNFDWGEMSSVVVELSGVGAWFAVHLRFLDCLSVMITAMVIRFTLNFIPFIG